MGTHDKRARPLHVIAGLVILLALAGVAATACGGTSDDSPAATPSPRATPMTLKVMEFNIEYGGTTVDFAKVVEAVRAADPDVIGLEEAETNTPRLAKAAGYPYWSNSMQVVSRYPLLEPLETEGNYLFVEVQPGACVVLSNVHLPSEPYGPNWIRAGKTVDEVVANEQEVRLPAIQKQLEVLPPLADDGIPVFLLGDFNAPSHRDYTEEVVGTRDYVKYVVEWPVSAAVEAAGFVDAWRVAYPDPLESLGLTWWAARPKVDGWNPGLKAPQDRIDFVYSAGPAKATAAQLAGENGGPEVAFAVRPWPSDHRAVVGTFEVTPAPLPLMVSVDDKVVTVGGRVVVRYGAPPEGAAKVVVVPAGGAVGAAAAAQAVPDGATSGETEFDAGALGAGDFEAVLLDDAGEALARAPFSVQEKGAKPLLTTDAATYASGDPIIATWKNAPANRWDWLGVYKKGADDPNIDSYLIWQYTGGALSGTAAGPVAGSLTLDADSVEGEPWPLPAGKYVLYYLLADGYEAVAATDFTVTK